MGKKEQSCDDLNNSIQSGFYSNDKDEKIDFENLKKECDK